MQTRRIYQFKLSIYFRKGCENVTDKGLERESFFHHSSVIMEYSCGTFSQDSIDKKIEHMEDQNK